MKQPKISKTVLHSLQSSSWIRKMFEAGSLLAKKVGPENVFDMSIGNPTFEPPQEVLRALEECVKSKQKGTHRYMSNQGFPETRKFLANLLNEETGLVFEESDITMCVGAASGLNCVMRTLLEPEDEVVIFSPFFAEYNQYISNFGGKTVVVPTNAEFQLDFEALQKALSLRTRAVMINSPNNPTGVVYAAESIKKLGEILKDHSRKIDYPVRLISDEPYRRIVFDQVNVPWVFNYYDHSILVTSFSKDLALPGERIGYVAISPKAEDRVELTSGVVMSLRVLGFVNAPALMQRVLPLAARSLVDLGPYQKNRDILWGGLTQMGYECVKPEGAFYLFPKSPIKSDLEFAQLALEENLILVPGTGFGMPGYFRVSYCFETSFIERSLPIFEKVLRRARA